MALNCPTELHRVVGAQPLNPVGGRELISLRVRAPTVRQVWPSGSAVPQAHLEPAPPDFHPPGFVSPLLPQATQNNFAQSTLQFFYLWA